MSEYEYEVVDRNGRLVTGRAEADSVTELVRSLSAEGHTVVEVNERRAPARPAFRRRVRMQDRVVAFHELATLLESGVPLGDAVQAQARGSHHPALTTGFQAISQALMRGQGFREALRAGQLALPEYVYHLVEAGELSGRLAQSLRQAVEQMRYDQRVAAEMRSALVYPSILFVAGFAAVLLVFVFVVPQFANLLDDGNELPVLSEAVLRTGVWFNDHGWWIAGAVAAAIAVGGAAWRRQATRQRIRDALDSLPVVRGWLTEADTAKWASVMGAMLTSRVELMDALGLASRGVRISRRRAALEQVASDVRGGAALSTALEKHSALTPAGYSLLRVGEQSGQLAQMLHALAALCEENSTRRMKQFLMLIEPAAILLIGVFLGVIMIGIILAITSVNDIAF